MIRLLLIAGAAASFLMEGAARAADVAPPVARCIADNAGQVEGAIPSLPEATDFLVNSVCINVIAEDQRQRQADAMQKWSADQRRKCDAKKAAGQSTKLGAGEDSYDPCAVTDTQDWVQTYSLTLFGGKQTADPDATSLAARTLLRIRLNRATSTQPH
jgi:hypothetical protein